MEFQILSDYEIERGKPMPGVHHALTQYSLLKAFSRHDEKYLILPELSLEAGERPLVPDISIYEKSQILSQRQVDWQHDKLKMTEPPLTAVEILSPRQPLDDLMSKAEVYLEAGTRSCWIVQPSLETITILEPGKKPETYTSGEIIDPATGITVTIEEIFI